MSVYELEAYLMTHNRAFTTKELTAKVGGTQSTIQKKLRRLLRQHRVKAVTHKVCGGYKPLQYYYHARFKRVML